MKGRPHAGQHAAVLAAHCLMQPPSGNAQNSSTTRTRCLHAACHDLLRPPYHKEDLELRILYMRIYLNVRPHNHSSIVKHYTPNLYLLELSHNCSRQSTSHFWFTKFFLFFFDFRL